MLAAPSSTYRGEQVHELTLKAALQRLNPAIHFDLGANLQIWHPKVNRWQGVFHNGRHVGAMGRGPLPEFNLYREEPLDDGTGYGRGELLEIGWRTTIEQLVKSRVPGVSQFMACMILGKDHKKFCGDPRELHIPESVIDPVHNTLG